LGSYKQQKVIPQYSVLKHVNSKDEWLVEAHTETDFSALTDQDFEQTLLGYTTFLYSNRLTIQVSGQSHNSRRLRLDFKKWEPVRLDSLFTISGTATTPKPELGPSAEGKHPYVTTQSANNSVRGWCDTFTEEGEVLTIDSAVAGFCAYQPLSFAASDHVEKLTPKGFKINPEVGLFLATVINTERYRYSYGRKFNQNRIRKTEIKLPHKNNKPDWEYMKNYMKGLPHSKYLEITTPR